MILRSLFTFIGIYKKMSEVAKEPYRGRIEKNEKQEATCHVVPQRTL